MSENMTTSEPTTGEIVAFLSRLSHMMQHQLKDARASEMIDVTARRLRELDEGEKEALGYLGCMMEKEGENKKTIAALTARAEQAEAREKAAIKALSEYEDALYPTAEDVMRDLNTL